MKSMLQFIAAAACVAVLTACGGGAKTPTVAVVVQPDYKLTTTVTGSGLTAAAGDLVTFNYVGYLYDSTKADLKGAKIGSSVDSGSAFTGTVGVGALPNSSTPAAGWDQALLGMQPGGKRTAVLPANLTPYRGIAQDAITVNGITYPAIPASAAVVYDFEMINVSKATVITPIPPSGNLESSDPIIGTGDAAAAGKTLTVTYNLYLYDGTRVNLRGPLLQNGSGFSFVLGAGSVIKGWDQGLVGMLVGGTRTLQIPPSLGYGSAPQYDSAGNVTIPANSTLIFDVQLTSMK